MKIMSYEADTQSEANLMILTLALTLILHGSVLRSHKDFLRYDLIERILDECLLAGKASRTLVESRVLPSDSTCVLEAELGKLGIRRHKPGACILFINLPIGSFFKTTIMT